MWWSPVRVNRRRLDSKRGAPISDTPRQGERQLGANPVQYQREPGETPGRGAGNDRPQKGRQTEVRE